MKKDVQLTNVKFIKVDENNIKLVAVDLGVSKVFANETPMKECIQEIIKLLN